MERIRIQFFHDVICSFCFPMSFRMRKLKKIMPDVDIIHRSFALAKDDYDFKRMFGSRAEAKNEILTHWDHANQNDDLHRFNIKGMRVESFLFPASMKPLWACKAAYFVAGETGYWDLFDSMQASLFMKNKNIELNKVIFDNVKLVGLDFKRWQDFFNSDEVKSAVEADFMLAKKYGLQSVPTLIINDNIVIRGAVSLEYIKQTIARMKNNQITNLPTNGACGIDGCS